MRSKRIIILVMFLISSQIAIAESELVITTGTNNEDYWGHQISGQRYSPIQTFKLGDAGKTYQINSVLPNVQSSGAGTGVDFFFTIRDSTKPSGNLMGTSESHEQTDISTGFSTSFAFTDTTINGDTTYTLFWDASAYGSQLIYIERNSATNDYADGQSGYYRADTDANGWVNYDFGVKIYYEEVISDAFPVVTLGTPANATSTDVALVNFNCSATDDSAIQNMSLYTNFTGSWLNTQANTSGASGEYIFTETATPGDIVWNCKACDDGDQCDFAESNFTYSYHSYSLDITDPTTGDPTTVSGGDTLTITFEYLKDGVNVTSGVSVDNVTINGQESPIVTTGVAEVNNSVEFETFTSDLGNWVSSWENDAGCAWTIDSDGTPSTTTGPCGGVSNCPTNDAGYDDNSYVYVETSAGTAGCDSVGASAILTYSGLDMDTYSNATLYFAYNMYGADMGGLYVQIDDGVGGWDTLFTKVGNQGTDWFYQEANITGYTGSRDVRFKYTRIGTASYRGDIALDVLNITGVTGGSVEQLIWKAGVGWQVNVTTPSGLTGLQDLYVNATYDTYTRDETESSSVNYGAGGDDCDYGGSGNWIINEDCTVDTNTKLQEGYSMIVNAGYTVKIADGVTVS